MQNDARDDHVTSSKNAAIAHKTPRPSRASRRGLDGFVFFTADVQTGFGAFVAVYLTAEKWTQVDIGLILTIGSLVGLASQIPGGAAVDATRSMRRTAATAIIAIGAGALALAAWPIFAVVLASRIAQAVASSVLAPAMAAISLGLVGRHAIGERLGRNASFASLGTGLAAAGMGACGYYLSNRAVFFVAAAMVVPALISLFQIRPDEINPERAHGGRPRSGSADIISALRSLLADRTLVIFAGCVMLFQFANAAMLPLAASMLTLRSSQAATILVATAIVVPQFIVAALSPWVGRRAELWGRRPLLILGFGALAVRGALFVVVIDPHLLVAVQLLDGISAAVLGVLTPLTIADVTRGTGHFNLAQGMVGCAVGVGAAISTTLIGYLSDHFGSHTAFLTMAGIAAGGFAVVWLSMPETRPNTSEG
ncbi:MFS transporter [Methylocella tundrae]|uniref:ABC transporter permease n=1 Tax=Methylocella tundrae TaxID=227605 RepID=A0A4U8Z0P1_METTU|nr:MFS transporter [Methylocella tundrae]WPP06005.1 MFS transporter [Methylocella tundrae]VFU08581.1 ABC transporter permease [Methylocella tundrae]